LHDIDLVGSRILATAAKSALATAIKSANLFNIERWPAAQSRHDRCITAPLSATIGDRESVMLPSDPKGGIMPSLQLKLVDDRTRYTIAQLTQLRRQMLRFARSLPRGSHERNERRQIAASLRSLFRNKVWRDVHTMEGSVELAGSSDILSLPH
jgi:hypothetical protein